MEPKVTRPESERQSEHFRMLQNRSFWMTQFYFGGGLAALVALSLLLPDAKFNTVSPIIFTILGVVLREWSSVNGYSFSTSAGAARSNETLRKIVDATKPVEDVGA